MDKEEKDYIDKKFADIEDKYLNPDPEAAMERAKKYRNYYYKHYIKWIVLGVFLVILTMIISFRVVGLF